MGTIRLDTGDRALAIPCTASIKPKSSVYSVFLTGLDDSHNSLDTVSIEQEPRQNLVCLRGCSDSGIFFYADQVNFRIYSVSVVNRALRGMNTGDIQGLILRRSHVPMSCFHAWL